MSVWNPGKYHWEEHNCNEWADKRLKELVAEIKIPDWEIKDTNFKSITTARSIRKGREIRSFEVVFDLNFKHNEMEGKISFPDISNDAADSPEEWEYILEFTGSSKDKSPNEKKAVRNAADKEVVPVFRQMFAQWVEEFKSLAA
ncbi:activator of 90 kDa heat shock protein ATPase [Histomonas meleagridis]|uniref:activator of 90 kDa heat shock protein ATPase-like n=1 Tax=Histomonas meleagridis TaxID=135588 RepID=UPI00355A591E|nr:activator of 90 kDa heat shock protein ATPase [Histomonas meleagridis]KAH0806473.1 activator of 90 kDa heat shock protein ATPase-like [Histomonas meleagridis]